MSVSTRQPIVIVIAGAMLYVALVFLASLAASGQRSVGEIENIHGVPFAGSDADTIITEKLAHADIYLQEPVIAKQLTLKVSFIPQRAARLSVGIRQDPFWLSYQPVDVYKAGDGDPRAAYSRTIVIPLSEVIQDRDRSIDMMLFADYAGGKEDLAEQDTTLWTLRSLEARVDPVVPSKNELKSYLASWLKRERPL